MAAEPKRYSDLIRTDSSESNHHLPQLEVIIITKPELFEMSKSTSYRFFSKNQAGFQNLSDFKKKAMIIVENQHKIIGWVLRASFLKDGVRYYARDYGKKAFRVPIYRK